MASPRKTSLSINYKGKKLKSEINKYIESYSFTEVASGESDSISVSLHSIDGKWINEYMPEKGDSISSSIIVENWSKEGDKKTINCGSFTIDDISFTGRPLSGTIGAVSVPANEDFKATKRTKTWQNTNIKEIASEIAKSAGITLYYEAGTVKISEREQDATDSSFLSSLCTEYGLALKVFNNKLVIFDESVYEKKAKIATIKEEDIIGKWSYNTTLQGSYTGARLSYSDPDSDDTITVEVGNAGRIYEFSTQADSRYDAELKATAKVNQANKKITTMSVKVMPTKANMAIIASSVVEIAGLGKLSGNYYVDKVVHNVSSNGYTIALTLHKVNTPMATPSAKAVSNAISNTSGNYTVKSGDNLWSIARAHYGNNNIVNNVSKIYNANKDVIEAAAKAHGLSSSDNGHWIYPGTVLIIP